MTLRVSAALEAQICFMCGMERGDHRAKDEACPAMFDGKRWVYSHDSSFEAKPDMGEELAYDS